MGTDLDTLLSEMIVELNNLSLILLSLIILILVIKVIIRIVDFDIQKEDNSHNRQVSVSSSTVLTDEQSNNNRSDDAIFSNVRLTMQFDPAIREANKELNVAKKGTYKNLVLTELDEKKLEVFHERVNSSKHSTFDDVRFKMQFDSDIRESKKELTIIKRTIYKTLVLQEIREEQLQVLSKMNED